jgi:hypothetical protein
VTTTPSRSRRDGAIGEWSQFQTTNGFYIQGVGRGTAILPAGWEDRLVPLRTAMTNQCTGLCLEPHDLCLAKLAAYRAKHIEFVTALLGAGLVRLDVLEARVEDMQTAGAERRAAIRGFIRSFRSE